MGRGSPPGWMAVKTGNRSRVQAGRKCCSVGAVLKNTMRALEASSGVPSLAGLFKCERRSPHSWRLSTDCTWGSISQEG
jgi:hypothetical protein